MRINTSLSVGRRCTLKGRARKKISWRINRQENKGTDRKTNIEENETLKTKENTADEQI
jgi:hypothetical protein